MTPVRALTITQPWASLVALGYKRVETRDWAPPQSWGGVMLVHAAKGMESLRELYPEDNPRAEEALRRLCSEQPFAVALQRAGVHPVQLPRGKVVAVAEVARATRMTPGSIEALRATKPVEHAFGHYAAGRFAWVLKNVRPLAQPVTARGAQKLWIPDAQVLAAVAEQDERVPQPAGVTT